MKRNATLSLAMLAYLPADEPDRLSKTLARMGDCIDQAADLGSDIVAFPEIVATHGAADSWQFEPLDGPIVTAMAKKARARSLYVVCPLGTLENGHRYNSSVLIGRDGAILGVYHKNFPTHGELDRGVVPGTEAPVFETDVGRVGLCICFDLNYWEVGAQLCANKAELVIWSSMWAGARMLTRWAIEFGFYMGAVYTQQGTIVDLAGRELLSITRAASDRTGRAPLATATVDLDHRLLHHDGNVSRLKGLFDKYGSTAAYAEHLDHECLLIFGSQLPDRTSDDLIAEFGMEHMRDYLARVRRDRKSAIAGAYEARRS